MKDAIRNRAASKFRGWAAHGTISPFTDASPRCLSAKLPYGQQNSQLDLGRHVEYRRVPQWPQFSPRNPLRRRENQMLVKN